MPSFHARESTGNCTRDSKGQRGFTLAGLIVILTIIAMFVAYTVPRQWSKVLQREREKQTIFVMKQYARAIATYQKAHGMPTSLDQLKQARLPRVIRGPKGEYVDPMTGKVDWILVPPGAIQGGVTNQQAGMINPVARQAVAPQGSTTLNLAASPKDYVGPFIGVRLPITGKAMLTFRDSDSYEQWFYTTTDLDIDTKAMTTVNPNP